MTSTDHGSGSAHPTLQPSQLVWLDLAAQFMWLLVDREQLRRRLLKAERAARRGRR